MSLLTTAQLTFCDLKDSYSIHVDTECIGLVCGNNGAVSSKQKATIKYRVFAGSTMVGASCNVSGLPDGVIVSRSYSSSSASDGMIEFTIFSGATLGDKDTYSVKVVFTTLDAEQFTFEKYITFIKSIAGHDGTDAVDFQIYSVDGFEFSDYVTTIQLKTVAFEGGQLIDSNATYKWMWWNSANDAYEDIPSATSQELTVDITDEYAFTSLKCEMVYDGITYEDYVSLTKRAAVYTAMAKFFNGSNVIKSGEDYLLAYVELYKDAGIEDQLAVNEAYVSNANAVQDGIIVTDIDGSYKDGDMMYFVCQTKYDSVDEYDAVLGEYNTSQWHVVQSKYVYSNDLFTHATSPIVFIPKAKISKSLNINFEIKYENDIIARTSAMALDLNDPSVSSDAPTSPSNGQLWLDTSVSPSILKMWDGAQWVRSGYQDGNIVYTSKPTDGYEAGDLWIVADGEGFGQFSYGTMLRAKNSSSVFKESDWVDAMDIATTVSNIKESFTWNDSGVQIAKRVADSSGGYTTPFYVSIDSTRMGFHSVEYAGNIAQNDVEVVHIGNNSAVIQNATFQGGSGTKFENAASFERQINMYKPNTTVGFVWQIEGNGSLSLSVT